MILKFLSTKMCLALGSVWVYEFYKKSFPFQECINTVPSFIDPKFLRFWNTRQFIILSFCTKLLFLNESAFCRARLPFLDFHIHNMNDERLKCTFELCCLANEIGSVSNISDFMNSTTEKEINFCDGLLYPFHGHMRHVLEFASNWNCCNLFNSAL